MVRVKTTYSNIKIYLRNTESSQTNQIKHSTYQIMYVKLYPSKMAPFCISTVSARRNSGPIFFWDHKFTVICRTFWCHIVDTGSPCLESVCLFVCFWRDSPQWARASSFTRFLDHTQWRTAVGRTPLDKWSARHRGLYLTTHNTHNRQMSMSVVVFEPTTPAGERSQTLCLRPREHWDRLRSI
jgi:hypothetical protein